MDERAPKSYQQMCPLAMALDHVGDRWSMLIARELLGGPARFSDLMRALPGIASNLLTDRLRRLESSAVIERRATTAGPVYAMTPLGLGLRAPLEALGAWGMRAGPIEGSDPRTLRSARSAAMGLEAMLAAGDAPATRRCLELRVGDEALTVEFGGSEPPNVRYGSAETPDGRATTSMDALRDLPLTGPTAGTFEPGADSDEVVGAFVDCLASGITRFAG